jgi:hypothetical protein
MILLDLIFPEIGRADPADESDQTDRSSDAAKFD